MITAMPAKQGFQLVESDVTLLHYAFQLRVATLELLAQVAGRSYKNTHKRVQKLAERKYLSILTKRPEKHIYATGPESVPILIDRGFAPADLAEKRLRNYELKQLGMKHFLHVAAIHARLIALTRHGPVELAHWQEGAGLWDHAAVDGAVLPVRPDAWFTLRHTGRPETKNKLHYFLEADRSTLSHKRMEQKIMAYLAYHQQQRYAAKYPGMQTFAVATVTETRRRAKELERGLHSLLPTAKSRRAYLFLPIEDLTLQALLPAKQDGEVVPPPAFIDVSAGGATLEPDSRPL
jgi:hypothetical protein